MSRVLGSYVLVRLLGGGGQGRVYEARWRGAKGETRTVALKVVEAGVSLRREARLGGLLRHPNLVDVYEVGELEGTSFLAMELCSGGSIAAHLPLPPRAVVEVGLQVCAALGYAYEETKLVHLDLKPENLLLEGATVKVADLGISVVEGGGETGPRGTPGYMAPEQRLGGSVDARTDVWALGVVLRELATGRKGGHVAVTSAWDDDDDTFADEPGTDEADPPWLAPILERCLAESPSERFLSMPDLARALAAADARGPTLAEVLGVEDRVGPGATAADPPIGRDAELRALRAWVSLPGIALLRGPVGVGKTALAEVVAAGWRARGGEAVWCDLALARGAEGLLGELARALEVPLDELEPDRGEARVGRVLAARGDALVVLDGADAAASALDRVERWAADAPRARWIVTTRGSVPLPGVLVLDVAPLSEDFAVEVARRAARRRGVVLEDGPALRELVRRLDGLPLAVELAAGRLGVLGVEDVLERLSPSLLRSGKAGVAEHRESLRGALVLGYDLLDPRGRRILEALSAFRGGFTLEAASRVVGEPDAAGAVQELVDRSWVVRTGPRPRMLEPVREFVADLARDPEVRRRHARWAASLCGPAELRALLGPGEVERRRRLGEELANLEEACRWAADAGEEALAVATLRGIGAVLRHTGPLARVAASAARVRAAARSPDGRACAASLLAWCAISGGRPGEAELHLAEARAAADGAGPDAADEVLGVTVALHRHLGKHDEALAGARAALARAEAAGDPYREADALKALGGILRTVRSPEAGPALEQAVRLLGDAGPSARAGALGDLGTLDLDLDRLDEAATNLEEAFALAREASLADLEARLAVNLATLDRRRGDLGAARRRFAAARSAALAVGNRVLLAQVQTNLGVLHRQEGRRDEARACLEEALALHRETGNRHAEASTATNLGNLLGDLGELDLAAARQREALTLFHELGDRRGEGAALANLANVLVEADRLDEAGRLFEEAVALHRAVGSARPEAYAWHGLATLRAREGRTEEASAARLEALRLAEACGDAVLAGVLRGESA